ncbi:hypothetical protein [Microvirga sp. CF3016]|uniref:hypothetical protein n=1 Tax=Microvirga sp. CF3016 TaxID=3110181 RepID=UPI002E7831E6|nr:hypothetical protein [Microvirga sp. CF3016]MEE1613414.1 hypothetical protein [Microvirga sp. CF3016]
MSLAVFRDRLWDLALVFGGVSIVARSHAWTRFKAALANVHSLDMGDRLYQRDWDFRYWHGIGLRTAQYSILCSILWLFTKLLYP